MKQEALRKAVCKVNRDIFSTGLAALTFGNASGVDRDAGLLAIKPSGVDYGDMNPGDMVLVDAATGAVVDGRLRPSSDTATHLVLVRAFGGIGGVVHTHSRYATAFAQARKPIPCLGTTHADYFRGPVPLTRMLTRDEVDGDYETNTGRIIVELFEKESLDPDDFPGVLVAGHGPFAWGRSVAEAFGHACALEEVARLAFDTLLLRPDQGSLPGFLAEKHFGRKHGAGAYYGQTR